MKVHKVKKSSFALLTGLVLFILTGSIFGQNMFRKINDFDGDGKTDLAIWRNGTYWIYGSQNGVSVFNWGLPTDKPIGY